jgi:transposase
MLLRYAGQHVHHMQKALEQMNVKLAEAVSDVVGLTGIAIVQAILHGERDPLKLAKLRNVNCKRTEAETARALHGNWRDEHLFALKQALTLHEFYQQQMRECDIQLQLQLGCFADRREVKPLPHRSRPHRKRVHDQ